MSDGQETDGELIKRFFTAGAQGNHVASLWEVCGLGPKNILGLYTERLLSRDVN